MTKYKLLRIIFIFLGLAMVTIGICIGDCMDTFRKATKICYECIGIG